MFLKSFFEKIFFNIFPNSLITRKHVELRELRSSFEVIKEELKTKESELKVKNEEFHTKDRECYTLADSLSVQTEWLERLSKELKEEQKRSMYLFKKSYEKNYTNKIKIGFVIFFYEHWDSLDTVYKAFLEDSNFEAFVFVGPRRQFDDQWRYMKEGLKYLSERGVKCIPLYNEKRKIWVDLKKYKLDYVFLNSPWEGSWPEKYWIRNLSKVVRVCYIPYGIIAARMQNEQFNQEFHHKCWRIFAESPLHKELFAKYSEIKDKNVVISGYPKLDFYLHPEIINNPWNVGSSDKYKIIWAPHWSVGETSEVVFSSFYRLFEFFYKLLQSRKDIYLMIKPHPGLWPNLVKQKIMTNEEINSLKQRFKQLPNCEFYESPGYLPYFLFSDAMITDSISFISEYLPTKKPLLFITKNNKHKFNEYGEMIKKSLYLGWTTRDIKKFVDDVIVSGFDEKKAVRLEILEKYIYIPKEGAAKEIVKSITREHNHESI